jgi:uncharacterized protein
VNATLLRGTPCPGLALLIGSVALLFSTPVLADVKKGVDAWSRGEFAAAVRQWQGPAAKGDADAQFNLAQAYKLGRGVTQDLAKAERLFAQAAAQGHLQAADNLGLLLFQRGERAGAMPYIEAASGRGDPRAHYVLGLAHFNGDGVEKDWERAYALVSLAQQAGLPQAAAALSQMDEHIPLETRQRSVTLAAAIAAQSEQARRAQVAAADLEADSQPPRRTSLRPFQTPPVPEPGTPGADYTPGRAPPIAGIINSTPPAQAQAQAQVPKPAAIPATPKAAPPKAAPVAATRPAAAAGPWRVQLGAFGVPGNADRLWDRLKSRPELAGRTKLTIPSGRVTKLQAGGFASQESAQAACNRLKAGGFECLPVRD